jgi:hypothetical protein
MPLVKVPTSAQLADILTKGLHLQKSSMCVEDPGTQEYLNSYGGGPELLFPQEGKGCQGYQVESRWPLRGVCRRLGGPRPELDIDLNPSRPGDRRPEKSQLVGGSGPVRICR